jgi:hypothetical protein
MCEGRQMLWRKLEGQIDSYEDMELEKRKPKPQLKPLHIKPPIVQLVAETEEEKGQL